MTNKPSISLNAQREAPTITPEARELAKVLFNTVIKQQEPAWVTEKTNKALLDKIQLALDAQHNRTVEECANAAQKLADKYRHTGDGTADFAVDAVLSLKRKETK